ncbi:hypothetical protein [Parasitella parasitica]|uniref:Uncharacterized protein n=1 Tax=Parasitella parasitica TaxID=35722 RepID=A0A0B7NGM3_9FUNG|nr:hypothetical protein [Parasitella parasitica]
MGLPLYKPKGDDVIFEKNQAKDAIDDEFWITPLRQSHNHGNSRRPSHRSSNSNHNSHLSVNRSASNTQPRVGRIARRRSMLNSSFLDRRRDARVPPLPGSGTILSVSSITSAETSPPLRSELDRRLHQRITEKEDLLEQLRITGSLLDQFLSARAALGRDTSLPSFITEDLPAVLESASSIAAMSPSLLATTSPAVTDETTNNEITTLQEMVDRLLRIPPYSVRIQYIEQGILSAHRRIREQLSVLGSSSSGIPQNAVTPNERIINHLHVRRRPVTMRGSHQTAAQVTTERRMPATRFPVEEEINT